MPQERYPGHAVDFHGEEWRVENGRAGADVVLPSASRSERREPRRRSRRARRPRRGRPRSENEPLQVLEGRRAPGRGRSRRALRRHPSRSGRARTTSTPRASSRRVCTSAKVRTATCRLGVSERSRGAFRTGGPPGGRHRKTETSANRLGGGGCAWVLSSLEPRRGARGGPRRRRARRRRRPMIAPRRRRRAAPAASGCCGVPGAGPGAPGLVGVGSLTACGLRAGLRSRTRRPSRAAEPSRGSSAAWSRVNRESAGDLQKTPE